MRTAAGHPANIHAGRCSSPASSSGGTSRTDHARPCAFRRGRMSPRTLPRVAQSAAIPRQLCGRRRGDRAVRASLRHRPANRPEPRCVRRQLGTTECESAHRLDAGNCVPARGPRRVRRVPPRVPTPSTTCNIGHGDPTSVVRWNPEWGMVWQRPGASRLTKRNGTAFIGARLGGCLPGAFVHLRR